MQLLYRALLFLYPAEYKTAFALEMVDSFEQAQEASRKRGIFSFVQFTICEVTGLIKGLFSERMAKAAARGSYLHSRCDPQQPTELLDDLASTQRRLVDLIHCMEFAIAHHDFPKARLYSLEERAVRLRLQGLLGENNSRRGLSSCA